MIAHTDPIKKFTDMGIDEVVYDFYDSSVPPPYHRSYTITVKPDTVHIVVDSYGTIISDRKFGNTQEQFDHLIGLLDDSKIKNVKETDDDGCTGGTGEAIACYKEGEKLFRGYARYCGGKRTGDLGGDIASIKDYIISLIPDFSGLMKRED